MNRARRNSILYNYDQPRGMGSGANLGGKKEGGAGQVSGDGEQRFMAAKDGKDEMKKEKEKKKEQKKGAPAVTEVRKHIKYLIHEHEKREREENATMYSLIKKDGGGGGEESDKSLPLENWDAATPGDLFGEMSKSKKSGRRKKGISGKRRDL